jgi:outer membrane autotransporter protein
MVRGGKNVRSGKSGWGEGVQPPKEVQLIDDDRWGFFITATGDFVSAGDVTGYDGTTVGTTLGIDCRLSNHFLVGVSVGYSHSDSDLFDGSEVAADGGKLALYGMYQEGNFFVEGLIGGGYNNYDTKRIAFLGNAHGSTSGTQFDAYLGVGYDVRMGNWTVTPMISLLYTRVGIDGYDEVGSLVPLDIVSQHASSLRARFGPRVAYTTHWGIARVTPSFSVQWQHEFLDEELPFSARFANDADSLFTVHGPKIGRDSVLLTAALNVGWRRYAAYLAYQADLGRENYESQTALVGFRVSW